VLAVLGLEGLGRRALGIVARIGCLGVHATSLAHERAAHIRGEPTAEAVLAPDAPFARPRDAEPISELPIVRLRALTAADVPRLRSWGGLPERYLGIEELLDAARVPDTVTWLALDADDHVVAVFQAAPDDGGERGVELLVRPGRRGAGYGTACVRAILDQPCFAGDALRAVIDRENVASLRCFSTCGFVPDDDAGPGGYAELVRVAPVRVPLAV
jgi:GNAT superfamily N-acetyltransferase